MSVVYMMCLMWVRGVCDMCVVCNVHVSDVGGIVCSCLYEPEAPSPKP